MKVYKGSRDCQKYFAHLHLSFHFSDLPSPVYLEWQPAQLSIQRLSYKTSWTDLVERATKTNNSIKRINQSLPLLFSHTSAQFPRIYELWGLSTPAPSNSTTSFTTSSSVETLQSFRSWQLQLPKAMGSCVHKCQRSQQSSSLSSIETSKTYASARTYPRLASSRHCNIALFPVSRSVALE